MFLRLAIPLFLLFLLPGCQTLTALQQDMESLLESGAAAFQGTDETWAAVADQDNVPCPPLSLVPELSQIVEFKDLSNPSAKTEQSRLRIKEVRGMCNLRESKLVMDLTFAFDGKLGPAARARTTDKASFAFPYFVAVTDPKGSVLSKEIFAAALTYEAGQDSLQMEETISQSMPLAADGALPSYSVVTGFQLAPEQLAYNRKLAEKN